MNDKARCDDCGRVFKADDLAQPERLSERLDPGGTVPAGECPECGALAYPVEGQESQSPVDCFDWDAIPLNRKATK